MKYTNALKQKYETLWATMKVHRAAQAQKMANLILKGKARYKEVEKLTGVPWEFTGLTHYREATCDFRGVLHNGQKIIGTDKKTTIVPKGRGPFNTWEEAAVDALVLMGLQKEKDWSVGRMAFLLEGFNGYGYHGKGINSPYLWGGTNHYTKGKYVRDHVYDPEHVDQQLGVMAILKVLRETAVSTSDPKTKPETSPGPKKPTGNRPTPTQTSVAGGVLGVLASLWYGYWWVLPVAAVVVGAWLLWRKSRKQSQPSTPKTKAAPLQDQASAPPSPANGEKNGVVNQDNTNNNADNENPSKSENGQHSLTPEVTPQGTDGDTAPEKEGDAKGNHDDNGKTSS
jgi:lysozyme family protein